VYLFIIVIFAIEHPLKNNNTASALKSKEKPEKKWEKDGWYDKKCLMEIIPSQ